jgi:hypothetical protein
LQLKHARWLILMHQLPPQPDYFRVKVWRRLRAIGAAPLKNSVYVLPNTPEAREDFEWLSREIVAGNGEATLCEANMISGTTDREVELLIAHSAKDKSSQADLGERTVPVARKRPRGATWVTRTNVHVDRIASAWLIRRFIDPKARFKFVAPVGYRAKKGELRFDMFDAEYTHVGALCTFEVLMEAFRLADDDALRAVADLVHDIDCKDDSFGREETRQTDDELKRIYALNSSDYARLDVGGMLFESLYAMFGGDVALFSLNDAKLRG